MLRHGLAGLLTLLLVVGVVCAADKEVKGTVVKVDAKKNTITVKTTEGEKTFDINDETKILGPKGGVSDARLKDDRFVAGAEVKLLIAGNNRTAREIHLPERTKAKDK
jgi:hypothetical protein